MTESETYRTAADKLRNGWVRGSYARGGSVCLVGAVDYANERKYKSYHSSFSSSSGNIGMKQRKELSHRIVRRHPISLVAWFSCLAGKPEAWNDAPWRRKKAVLKVLTSLAKSHEKQEAQLKDKLIFDLNFKVNALKTERANLVSRIEQLEEENKTLRGRILNTRQLELDRLALQELDKELDKLAV